MIRPSPLRKTKGGPRNCSYPLPCSQASGSGKIESDLEYGIRPCRRNKGGTQVSGTFPGNSRGWLAPFRTATLQRDLVLRRMRTFRREGQLSRLRRKSRSRHGNKRKRWQLRKRGNPAGGITACKRESWCARFCSRNTSESRF